MVAPAYEDPAFEALYRRHFVPLVHGLSRIVDAQEAFDAVQEGFLRAGKRWAMVGGLDRPDLWVRRVALNPELSVAVG